MDNIVERGRMRIALLVGEMENQYIEAVMAGVETAAEEMDADVVIFAGRSLKPPGGKKKGNRHYYQHNTIYSYAAANDFDIILVELGSVAKGSDEQEMRDFLKQFGDTPVITLGGRVSGYPCVGFDNESGLYEGITLLIREHERRNIGFVAGPSNNVDSRERLLVYRETLMENGIAFDPHKVVHGTYEDDCDDIIETLLVENPDLDALVFANDVMALSGYRVLKKHNKQIGTDILVLGFDDAPFVLAMEPTLSTVRADAVKMGYEAVKQCQDMVNGLKDRIIIRTHLVVRESFGKKSLNFSGLNIKLSDVRHEHLVDSVLPGVYNVLLEGCIDREVIHNNMKMVRECVEYIFGLVYARPGNVVAYDVLGQKLGTWLRQKDNISIHKRVYILEYLNYVVMESLPDDAAKYQFAEMMKALYRDAYLLEDQTVYADQTVAEQINYALIILTRDMLNYANGDERTYASMVDKIDSLYLKECYLYVYPDIQLHKEEEPVSLPSHLHLRLYKNETEKVCPVGETLDIEKDRLFDNSFTKHGTRRTLIANMLFSAEEQYGVFVTSMEYRCYKYMRTIARQFSSAVKTIFLLRQNERLTARLENNIKQIKENNHVLSEISRRDELTGIYNRRGFMGAVEEELKDPANRDRKAIMVYADMNNLKLINDKYGHEEGDFSLRLIASMLKESFRSTDVIGRFGGDEFAAFALVDQENYVTKLRERIERVTEQMNAKTDKPFYISMSVGICEFLCEDGVSVADIMDTADGDLYFQKRTKRTEILK